METFNLTSAQDNVTGEYRQVHYMRVQNAASLMTQFWLLVTVSCVAALALYFLAWNLGKLPADFRVGIQEIVIGVIVSVAALLTQVWMHVQILRFYGAKPELGLFRNGIFYISVPRFGLRRNSVIVAALTPPVVLIGLSLIGIWVVQGTPWVALFALIAVVNAGASISHFVMIATLLRYPSSAWTVEDGHGVRILLPTETK